MAREVGITITAKDNASPAIGKATQSLDKLQSEVKAAPEKFAKASAAMNAFGGAAQQMGGGVAAAAGQVSQLGALLVSGGPVSLALVGISAVVAAVGAAFDKLAEAEKKAADELEAFQKFHEEMRAIDKKLIAEEQEATRNLWQAAIDGQDAASKNRGVLDRIEQEAAKRQEERHKKYLQRQEEQRRQHAEDVKERLIAEQSLADFDRLQQEEKQARADAWFAKYKAGVEAKAEHEKSALLESAKLAQENTESQIAAAQQVGAAFAATFSGVIAGQMSVADAFKAGGIAVVDSVIDTAQRVIIAKAAEAAAGAASSQAGIPYIGPILAVAAAAAIGGLVRGFLGQLRGMSSGGVVYGGVAGRDSVPTLLKPGERVLTTQERQTYEAGTRGGGVTLNVTATPPAMAMPNQAGLQRWVARDLGPELVRAVKDGRIKGLSLAG